MRSPLNQLGMLVLGPPRPLFRKMPLEVGSGSNYEWTNAKYTRGSLQNALRADGDAVRCNAAFSISVPSGTKSLTTLVNNTMVGSNVTTPTTNGSWVFDWLLTRVNATTVRMQGHHRFGATTDRFYSNDVTVSSLDSGLTISLLAALRPDLMTLREFTIEQLAVT